jgi:NADP-dependent 3-hydroxy acid dehydrogenase YdfG
LAYFWVSSDPPSTAGKVVLITGASSGIARSCAEQLATQGSRLILVARREKELGEVAEACNRLAGGNQIAFPVIADVSMEENCKYAALKMQSNPIVITSLSYIKRLTFCFQLLEM